MGKQKLPFLFCLCLKLSKSFTKCFIAVNSKHRVKLFIGAVWEITGSHFLTSSCVLSCSWLRYKVYFLFMYTFTTGKGINKLQDNIESVSDSCNSILCQQRQCLFPDNNRTSQSGRPAVCPSPVLLYRPKYLLFIQQKKQVMFRQPRERHEAKHKLESCLRVLSHPH